MKQLAILVSLLLCCSVSLAGQGMGPFGSAKGYSAGGGGGSIAFRDAANYVSPGGADGFVTTSTTLDVLDDDLIVCGVAGVPADGNITGVTCGSNTLVQGQRASTTDPYHFELWYIENAVQDTSTCTATWAVAGTYKQIACASYSGIATASALDQISCTTAGCTGLPTASTDVTAQNVTTTQASELVVFVGTWWDLSQSVTPSAGYNRRSPDNITTFLIDRVLTSTGTYPNGTIGTGPSPDETLGVFATFKGAQ